MRTRQTIQQLSPASCNRDLTFLRVVSISHPSTLPMRLPIFSVCCVWICFVALHAKVSLTFPSVAEYYHFGLAWPFLAEQISQFIRRYICSIIPFLPCWDYSVSHFSYLLIPWLRLSNNPKIADGSYGNAMATIEKELVQPVGASIHFDDYPSSGRGIIHLDLHRHHGQRNDLYSINRQIR
jgi:hypothetical protein